MDKTLFVSIRSAMIKAIWTVFFVVIVMLSGCTTTALLSPSGIPTWDYERDCIISHFVRPHGVIGTKPKSDGIRGLVGDQIRLTPDELKSILKNALLQSTPTNGQGLVSASAPFSTPKYFSMYAASWGISDSNEGQITTDWRPIPGRKAGLLFWKKTYQTEVRHTITIKRSFSSYRFANFSIFTEVRERANANYSWVPGDPELGRKSFEELKQILLKSVYSAIDAKRVDENED